jgi:deoxyribodipyrimidine photo-lyase
MWFRRDLRLSDHPALCHAARDGREVLPVFILDPALIRPSGAPRLAFMYRSLRALDEATGGRLVVRSGDPPDVLAALAAETGADEVVVTRDAGPYGRRRDAAVGERLRGDGVELIGRGSPYAVPPGTVSKDDGTPYAVFTPFFRAWSRIVPPAPAAFPSVNWQPSGGVHSEVIPDDPPLQGELPVAGEDAAHEVWARFREHGVDQYVERRNLPAVAGTSHLSPYLRWGSIHPRQLLADLGDAPGEATFRKEIAWREFYADVLFHQPRTARENLQPKMDRLPSDTDAEARARFDRWATGRTGYPIVDAGIRQMLATGWMHNRVRMIVASFLVKDLHLPWQWGARHFMQHLVDGDLASNQHGWQWTAGTGTDAAPFFRVFNPVSQGQKFDPDGDYVRRWVPELSGRAGPSVHQPTAPMVDHAAERAEALRRYQVVTGR